MRRKALIFVLALGSIAGFASALFGCHYHGMARREAFEDRRDRKSPYGKLGRTGEKRPSVNIAVLVLVK